MTKDYYVTERGEQLIEKMRRENSFNDFIAFCEGNVLKYETRAGKKEGLSADIKKADDYRAYAQAERENATFYPIEGGRIEMIACDGTDRTIDNAARISYANDGKQRTDKQVQRLINRLMREYHTSPFEMVHFTFKVTAPIFVLRQWMRHRTFSFNETSARYTKVNDNNFYVPCVEDVRGQHKEDNQAGGEALRLTDAEAFIAGTLYNNKQAYGCYESSINDGVARELARINLPQNMFSTMICKVSAHNLFHFMNLRSDWHSQYEIRVYSHAIEKIVKNQLPLSYAAWVEHRRDSVTLSASQWNAIKDQISTGGLCLDATQIRGLEKKISQ